VRNNGTLGSTRIEEGIVRKVKFKVVYINIEGRRCSVLAGGNYRLDYSKNSIVRAREGTFGIAVFKTRKQADTFHKGRFNEKIIRVRPVGRGKAVKLVCGNQSEFELDNFYNKRLMSLTILPPLGTIFYPAVEVLE